MIKKLNIGCGNNLIQDNSWVNIDNSLLAKLRNSYLWFIFNFIINIKFIKKKLPLYFFNYPKVKIVDIRKKLPFSENFFQYIYCAQVIEHLFYSDLYQLLSQCFKVLKPGGTIRILTPDLQKLIKLYNSSNIDEFKKNDLLDSKNLCDHFNSFFYPRSHVLKKKRSFLIKFTDFMPEQHKYIYDFNTLSKMMKEVGFEEVNIVETADSIIPDVKFLDQWQECSILLEAKKLR